MPNPAFRLCAPGLLAIAAMAQQSPPDPAIVMGGAQKQTALLASTWLRSPEPRLQAWGAYLVLRDRLTETTPLLLSMLARFRVVDAPAKQADLDQHDAMLGVLDALIQFGAPVPAADAPRIYPEFPVQSLILLSHSQEDSRRPRCWPSSRVNGAGLLRGWPPVLCCWNAVPAVLPRPSSKA